VADFAFGDNMSRRPTASPTARTGSGRWCWCSCEDDRWS